MVKQVGKRKIPKVENLDLETDDVSSKIFYRNFECVDSHEYVKTHIAENWS